MLALVIVMLVLAAAVALAAMRAPTWGFVARTLHDGRPPKQPTRLTISGGVTVFPPSWNPARITIYRWERIR